MDLYQERVLRLREHVKKNQQSAKKDYTKAELQEILKSKGIEFKNTSTKGDLMTIFNKEV